MQEILKVYTADGKPVLERDLSAQRAPLMIVTGAEYRLAETAPAGAEVVGALVRDEDGWTLVSRKADSPVRSGPKAGTDLHLSVGVGCELAGYVYRLEREGLVSGDVLIWKAGGDCTTDVLAQGRNVIATRPGSDTFEFNPAVIGDVLCEIYPTAGGIDVVTFGEAAARVSVDRATLFSVGAVRGMVLTAADAAKAIKSSAPFAWPARGTRSALAASMLVVGLVILAGTGINSRLRDTEAELASYRGAVRVAPKTPDKVDVSDEDVLVYEMAFFRALPTVLQAKPLTLTSDLIYRGEQLISARGISEYVDFLKEVQSIQGTIQKGEWDRLRDILAATDRRMYVKCDAEKFLDDAKEISTFVTEALPNFMAEVSKPGSRGFAAAGATLRSLFDGMSDNLFMSGEVVRRERDVANVRWEALSNYVPVRDAYLGDPQSPGDRMCAAWGDFSDAFDPDEASSQALFERERKLISDTLVERADKADDIALIGICELGETVGVREDLLQAWRKRANAARAELAKRYREMYNDYRMRAAVAPGAPETLAVLDRMVAIGLADNRYHQWALREIERLRKPAAAEGETPDGTEKSKE